LTNTNSSKKDSKEEDEKQREEAKKRILEEHPHISKDTLEFVLSITNRKTELETIHQQQSSKKKWKDYY